jgi:hypothetical protein
MPLDTCSLSVYSSDLGATVIQGNSGGTVAGLFAIVFVAALIGVFKPFINGAKRWHFGLGAFVAFILIGAFGDPSSTTASAPSKVASGSGASAGEAVVTPAAASPQAAKKVESEWTYSTQQDEMRRAESRFAQLEASNTLDLNFPYGEQRARILIRKSPKFGFDILVGVPSGQIMCNSFSNSHINVKFDDGPIQRFGCTDASDGSSNMIFVEGAKGFLGKLKQSKKAVVEAEFYQNGLQQMTFNTANLQWGN